MKKAPPLPPGPKQTVRVAAGIIVCNADILIAQRHATDRLAGLWEFPGGKIEAGETPEECLKRELREELDMHAGIGRALGTSIYHDEHMTIELLAFRAHWDGKPLRLVTHQAFRWVRPNQLVNYAFTPADLPFVGRLARGEISLS